MPDGSRRFAQRTGTDLRHTYSVGMQLFSKACRWCFEAGAGRVTTFVFALRHLRRSTFEKTALFSRVVDNWANSLYNLAHTCLACIGYSSKNQMTRAVFHLAKAVKAATITTDDVTAELVDDYIAHTECPDVDMLMRSAGPRFSDFMIMQCSYAYLHITPKTWPDVDFWEWIHALVMYQLHRSDISLGSVPSHVAIMPDGSRRFARRTGTDLRRTYAVGTQLLSRACRWCFEAGVGRVTAFVFALRHLRRSTFEKTAVFSEVVDKWANSLHTLGLVDRLGMRMMCVGQMEVLPEELQMKLADLDAATSLGRRDVTAELVDAYVAQTECPDVDMLMRSGGSKFSDFMMIQCSYAYLHMTPKSWPEVDFWEWIHALVMYQLHRSDISPSCSFPAPFMIGLGSFWIAVATIPCMASIVYSARALNDFVLHYEPLSYEPVSVGSRRWKRSAARPQAPHRVELAFRSHNREFRLRLERDRSAFTDDFTIETRRGPESDSLDHLYSGDVVGAPDSRVVGSIIGGVFSGRISLPREGEDFYVERAGHFFQDSVPPFHSLIYSANDVSFAGGRCGLHGATMDAVERIRRQYRRQQYPQRRLKRSVPDLDLETASMTGTVRSNAAAARGTGNQARNTSHPPPSERAGLAQQQGPARKTYVQRVCNLEIAVDHTLFEAVSSWQGGEQDRILRARQELTSMVAKHVKAVSEIFGATNFNGLTGIEFVVQRLVINDTSDCEGATMLTNPFCLDSLDAPHALHELSKINHDGFCASYLWTHRDFPGGTLGLAYMAEPDGFSGGICEQYQSGGGVVVDTGTTGYIGRLSLNTGVVTFLNKNMRVPQRVSEITFAHELGHNFGAPHDERPDCVPDGTGGNYIMYASATRGNKPNNRRFSICSVRNISAVLMQMFTHSGSRPNCLQEPQGPFCGNSIREMDEECDCGYEQQDCGADVCCYARKHGEINRKSCTLKPGAVCSPSNGACCSTDCRFYNTSTACRPEDDCTFEAYCPGTSGECPPSDWKPDGTLCNHATQLCDAGECSQSVCRLYNLVDCYLTGSHLSMEDMCLIACREDVPGSECKEACSFERMRDFCGRRMQPGAPCLDLQGYCDAFQRCRLIDAEGLLSRLKRLVFGGKGAGSALLRYWYLTVVAVVLSGAATVVFVRLTAVHTPSTNPHLPPERSIVSSALHPVALFKDMTRFY
ncbi:hypothetical protein MTO96_014135 [Rhipicephalus appendiculatus]